MDSETTLMSIQTTNWQTEELETWEKTIKSSRLTVYKTAIFWWPQKGWQLH